MNRFKRWVAAALTVALFLIPNPVLGQANYFWWQVVDETDQPYTGQTVQCSVYDLAPQHVSGQLAKVLHFTSEMTSGTTKPIVSDVNGRLHFYSSSSTDVRVNCFYALGGQGQSRVAKSGPHKIIIPRGYGSKVARFEFRTATDTTRSGLWLPQGAVIRDVLVQRTSISQRVAGGTENNRPHLNVGFIGDHSPGLMANHAKSLLIHALSLETGDDFIRPHVQASALNSTTPYAVLNSHRGLALASWHTAGNFGTTSFNPGWYYEKNFVVNSPGGVEVTYQTSAAVGVVGHVYIMFDLYHVGAIGSGIKN